MTPADKEWLWDHVKAALADMPVQSVAEWCRKNLTFDEANNHGPFETAGREYVCEVLEDFKNASVSDEVLVWGSQSRKTGTLMGGMAWCLANDPCGTLWVMPSITLAKKFSRQRWRSLVEASDGTRHLIPTGAKRHDWATLEQRLGSSTINFVGSNSPSNLASNPCRRVVLDEVDKFAEAGGGEADAVTLAEQRTKDQTGAQRWKTSTPTVYEGLIWQEFLKGDQRRYFVPCPHCSKPVVFAWSKDYTVFKITGSEAFVFWSKEAKRQDGSWDYEQVEKTAHALCPHCQYKIEDNQKTAMVRAGKWVATNPHATPGFVSRHLPSLYAASTETTFGKLAVKFLKATDKLGFITGDLAEPYQGQDRGRQRIELVATMKDKEGATKLLSVDCQAKSPHFWYVVRAWKGGNSEAVEAGNVDAWSEIVDIQTRHEIPQPLVFVDSGYGAKDDAEVYRECARNSELKDFGDKPVCAGWMPTKGLPGRELFLNQNTKLRVPFTIKTLDPYVGTSYQGRCSIDLLEFRGEVFKDTLQSIREGRGTGKWSVAQEVASEEYWKHLDGEVKTLTQSRFGKRKWSWLLRHKDWPNHLLDCEVIQLAAAAYLGLFKLETQ